MARKHKGTTNTAAEVDGAQRSLDVGRCGNWLPPDELRKIVIEAAAVDSDLTLNLEGIEHLDGSSLQTLLALGSEQRKRGRKLRLVQSSPTLRQWFEFAGAAQKFQFA